MNFWLNLVLQILNMRKLLLIGAIIAGFVQVNGQSFTVTTNTVSFSGTATANDIPSPVWTPTISNISGDTLILRWVRVEQHIPNYWRSSVCTEYVCSSIPDDSATITLLPGDNDMVYIHMYPYGFADTGNVVLKLFNVENPSDSARVMFHCDVATGIDEYSSVSFLHADLFSHSVKFIPGEEGTWSLMDVSGKIIAKQDVQPHEEYSVLVPRSGVYFFTFVNAYGFVETRKLIL